MKYFIKDIQQTDSMPTLKVKHTPLPVFFSQNEHTHYTKPMF